MRVTISTQSQLAEGGKLPKDFFTVQNIEETSADTLLEDLKCSRHCTCDESDLFEAMDMRKVTDIPHLRRLVTAVP